MLIEVAFMIMVSLANLILNEATPGLTLDGCPSNCGGENDSIVIPYPFGIGKGCYYSDGNDTSFKIECNNSTKPPKVIHGRNIEVLDINITYAQLRVKSNVALDCYDRFGNRTFHNNPTTRFRKFTLNTTQNVFAAVGCDTYAWFKGLRHGLDYSTGCMTQCNVTRAIENGTCSGVGCCEIKIPEGVNYAGVEVKSFSNFETTDKVFTPCGSAFVVEKESFKFTLANVTVDQAHMRKRLPVVYDWSIGNSSCSTAQGKEGFLCKGKSECHSMPEIEGYRCSCLAGYSGNPYLHDGCKDVNECVDPDKNHCEKQDYCKNTDGSYICQCPEGFNGNGTKNDRCVAKNKLLSTAVKVTAGFGVGIIALLLLGFWLFWQRQKKQVIVARETFFHQNGGHILLQRLSQREMSVDTVAIFTTEDLMKATNNFSESNIIGRGGFGLVYKGILTNNDVVAIKKSLKVDSTESEHFINEVIVLSRLNNRHVVKLLGCCLETEVPLLVYEFVDNGTLYDHLHEEMKASLLTWQIRLRIALEVAEVLSYLHTTILVPIIHRDVKSMNILLDKQYAAKVSDFGASRLVPIEQDQLATIVLGTRGYLDPEYLLTSELTQKSDVYSFGVVLVEILTRKDALSYDRPESDRCLANFFLRKLKEDELLVILDNHIVTTGGLEHIKEVATLARRCLNLKGEDRPTMKEIAMELHRVQVMAGLLDEENNIFLGETKHVSWHGKDSMLDSSSSQSVLMGMIALDGGR